jgi:hypothetical protein
LHFFCFLGTIFSGRKLVCSIVLQNLIQNILIFPPQKFILPEYFPQLQTSMNGILSPGTEARYNCERQTLTLFANGKYKMKLKFFAIFYKSWIKDIEMCHLN